VLWHFVNSSSSSKDCFGLGNEGRTACWNVGRCSLVLFGRSGSAASIRTLVFGAVSGVVFSVSWCRWDMCVVGLVACSSIVGWRIYLLAVFICMTCLKWDLCIVVWRICGVIL
jgi:hypothetical protein